MAEMAIAAQPLALTLDRRIGKEGDGVTHSRRIREVFAVKAVDDVTIGVMLGLGVTFDHRQQVEALPGLKEKFIGAFDDRIDIRAVQIPVDVIEADQGHEVETGRPATKEGKDLAAIKIMKGIDRLFAEEGVTLGFKKDPQATARFLDRNHAPVDRNIPDLAGIEVGQNRSQCFAVILDPAFEQAPVVRQAEMLNPEDGHGIGPESFANEG